MNKNQYRLVFNQKFGMLVAVAEITTSQSKGGSQGSTRVASQASCLEGNSWQGAAASVLFAVAALSPLNLHAQTNLGGLPTTPVTTSGSATYTTQTTGASSMMTVQQNTQNLGTNWQSFNIGAGNTVVFKQPNSASIAVNRVVGSSRAEIYGSLQSNGRVFLLSPSGVLFGRSSEVNVGSLLVSTKTMSDADMAAGNFNQLRLLGAQPAIASVLPSSITNLGNITTSASSAAPASVPTGFVAFAADQIFNDGRISAKSGQIILASGGSFDIKIDTGGSVSVKTTEATIKALVENSGLMVAQGGQIVLTAKGRDTLLSTVVNNSGSLESRFGSVRSGVIVLDGEADASIGAVGGDVVLTGRVDVQGARSGERGGTVVLTGQRVGLGSTAVVDASGDLQGGRVIVGGDTLGKVRDLMAVKLADQSVVASGSVIKMGAANGDGGFVETSGRNVQISGLINGASSGKSGSWLIDPTDITITATGSNSNNSGAPTFTPNGAGISNVLNGSINSALLTSNVVLDTAAGSNSGQMGNITVTNVNINNGGTNNGLTLRANGSISITGSNISGNGAGKFDLTLVADQAGTGNGGIKIISNSVINTNGGDLIASANTSSLGGTPISATAIFLSASTVTALGTGSNVSGVSNIGYGIRFFSGNQTIYGNVTGTALGTSAYGVYFEGGNQTISGNLAGVGGSAAAINFNNGNQSIFGSVTGTSSTGNGIIFGGGNQAINAAVAGNSTSASSAQSGIWFKNGNQTITGAFRGYVSTAQEGVNFGGGNQTFLGNVSVMGSSAKNTGLTFTGGTQNITIGAGNTVNLTGMTNNATSASVVGLNISALPSITNNGGNLILMGVANAGAGVVVSSNFAGTNTSIIGRSISNNGVQFSAGTQNLSGSTLIFGSSGSATGLSFAGGTQNITVTAGQTANITGMTNSTSALVSGLNVSLVPSINNNGGSLVLGGYANAGAGVVFGGAFNGTFVTVVGSSASNAGVQVSAGTQTFSGESSIQANASAGASGFAQTGGNIAGTGNLVIMANQSSQLGRVNLTGANSNLTINLSAGDLTLNGNLSASKNITLLAASQKLAGDTAGGDVIVGTAASITSNAGGSGGTTTIYSGTPNTANANTSAYQGLISGATQATTTKAYNTVASGGTVNASQKLNVFYRIAPNVTITANNNSKIYDTTNRTAAGNYNVTGLIDGDTVNSTASDITTAYNTSSAGTGLLVSVASTALVLNGSVTGYTVNQTVNATGGVIYKAVVSLNQSASVFNKTYDTTNNSAVNQSATYTVQLGSSSYNNTTASATTLTAGAANTTAGAFNQSAAGSGLTANVSYNLIDTTNYTFAAGTSTNSTSAVVTGLTINKAVVTIAGNATLLDKIYDGNAIANTGAGPLGTVALGNATLANGSVSVSALIASGNVTTSASYQAGGTDLARDVGTGKSVNITYAVRDTVNYTQAGLFTSNGLANITQAANATWIGGGVIGNWSDPANWQGGRIGDAANVQTILISAGTTATFDVAARVTLVTAIIGLGAHAGLTQSGSTLTVSNGAGTSVASMTQTGGLLTGNSPLTVTQSFNQTGGAIALDNATLTVAGASNVNNMTANLIQVSGVNITVLGTARANTTASVNALNALNVTSGALFCGNLSTSAVAQSISNAGTLGCAPAPLTVNGVTQTNSAGLGGAWLSAANGTISSAQADAAVIQIQGQTSVLPKLVGNALEGGASGISSGGPRGMIEPHSDGTKEFVPLGSTDLQGRKPLIQPHAIVKCINGGILLPSGLAALDIDVINNIARREVCANN